MQSTSCAPSRRRATFRSTLRRLKRLEEFIRFTGGLTIAATLSILIAKYVTDPDARHQIRTFVGLDVVHLEDIVVNGDLPDEDNESDEDAWIDVVGNDPCEKPLTLGCEFAREPDIEYLYMPPFIGPWEEPSMRLHWTIFVITSRWQLVCPAD